MPSLSKTYTLEPKSDTAVLNEVDIEYGFLGTLQGLKYHYRKDITDRAGKSYALICQLTWTRKTKVMSNFETIPDRIYANLQ
jgi:hypothetical protein